MVKDDEKIKSVRNIIAARGFSIWYFLLLGILLYRQLILRQPISQYGDIAAVFLPSAPSMSPSATLPAVCFPAVP